MDEQENREKNTNLQAGKVEPENNSQKLESNSEDGPSYGRPKIGDSRPAPNTPETGSQGKKKRNDAGQSLGTQVVRILLTFLLNLMTKL